MSKVRFLNVMIDSLFMDEAIAVADELVKKRNNSFIVTPNVDHLVLLESNQELRDAYSKADLVLADGMPIVWLSKYYGGAIKEKISGSDFLPKLCELSAQRGYKVFFLGAAPGVAEKAAENMRQLYEGLQVVGCLSPDFDFETDPQKIEKVLEQIKAAKPDILVVAFGCPKQEVFISKYKDVLNVPVCIGVGASLDFAAGLKKRAPKWMSDYGLEWFFRMWQEPGRMFKRYVLRDWRFLKLLWKYRKQK
ncbi:WecB/TagA/CpsF family glycosyltransferase [Fibrobacter sp.]|uniref:WecB/TagA/CpsF family glycosyltransferase n=1 Tax=Fibrobacter sp. TaxID=35828 RepID=UPI003863FF26